MSRRYKISLTSPTAKLAATYLAIIMIMSIGFSVVLYHASSHELGRQIPPDSFFNNQSYSMQDTNGYMQPSVNRFLERRAHEGRSELLTRLIILNVSALLVGSALSYVLARRTLEPIEEAMEAQVQFVSDASHELRTPLTAIQTSNEVALRKPKLTLAEAKALIAHNTDDIQKLQQLTDGLLNLAQKTKSDMVLSATPVQDCVSEAMNHIVQQALAKNIAVHDESADIKVLADRPSLVQALVILLDNAVKYSNDDTDIFIETEHKGKTAVIHVRDQGIGIRASDMPHLFRRFYRADNARTSGNRSGYGLGLAIAEQIIANNHGTISVHSTPQKGSTFSIHLSLA